MSKIIAENIKEKLIVDSFLDLTSQKGIFPTDPDPIIECLGLEQLEFDFVEEFTASSKGDMGDFRAMLSYDEKVIALNSTQKKNVCRTRFSLFHEIAHYVIPSHIQRFYLCSQEDMSERTLKTLEAEANKLAADFIYQKDVFTEEGNQYPIEAKSIFTLKNKYEASYESVARRFVETHVLPCALVAYGKNKEDKWDVLYTITSPAFKERFFSSVISDDENSNVQAIVSGGNNIEDTMKDTISVEIVGKGKCKFDIEYFFNRYRVFALLKPKLKKKRRNK